MDSKRKPYITIGLIVVNVLIFLYLEVIGDTGSSLFMKEHGAMYYGMLADGVYLPFLSSCFLHFGIRHLANNMVMLGAAGNILEDAMGSVKFLILYILAGLGGSGLSYAMMMQSGTYSVTAGASGAVFGLVGGLVWVVIRHCGRYKTLTGRGMLVMVALCLYYGVSSVNVDNWGHVGGLITGFILALLLYRMPDHVV